MHTAELRGGPGPYMEGCKSPFSAGGALSIMERLTDRYWIFTLNWLHGQINQLVAVWKKGLGQNWAPGPLCPLSVGAMEDPGMFSYSSLLWGMNNKTPLLSHGFPSRSLSWAKQPFLHLQMKTLRPREVEIRPTAGDQVRLADLYSKGLVLQIKQRRKNTPHFCQSQDDF